MCVCLSIFWNCVSYKQLRAGMVRSELHWGEGGYQVYTECGPPYRIVFHLETTRYIDAKLGDTDLPSAHQINRIAVSHLPNKIFQLANDNLIFNE